MMHTKIQNQRQYQRFSTKTHAMRRSNPVPQQSTIFQMDPPCGQVTLEDVDDIYPICSNLQDEEQKYACYACYGMDMEKVEKYYHFVKQLQQQVEKEKNSRSPPGEHILRVHLGKWRFTICLDILV